MSVTVLFKVEVIQPLTRPFRSGKFLEECLLPLLGLM